MTDIEYYQPNEAEQRLIDALRSGKYKQGQGVLQKVDELCCLGVACVVSKVELDVDIAWDSSIEVEFNGQSMYLPEAVQDELGWFDTDGHLTIGPQPKYGRLSLISLNDSDCTFDQIADVIEAGLVRRAS